MGGPRKRITGTNIYTWMKCARAVALDLHEDRAERRELLPWEEMVRERGVRHEQELVSGLDAVQPTWPAGDYEAGARATWGMMVEGVPWIGQGVLRETRDGIESLGLPDLLRCREGASAVGDHHYEVVDVKSSGRARGDQVLQVAFYSRLLGAIQERVPERGGVALKDGSTRWFRMADFGAALAEVEAGVRRVLAAPETERPFLAPACGSCHWSHRCLGELAAADDLSLLQGMTPGLRATLEAVPLPSCTFLASARPEEVADVAGIERVLARRLEKAARARGAGRPVRERRAPEVAGPEPALVHFLTDPFLDRVLYMGVLHPARDGGEIVARCPENGDREWAAFGEVVASVPAGVPLLHYGPAVPRWYGEAALERIAGLGAEHRFVDLARQLRGGAVYPAPVFGLADHVRLGLGIDPHRVGDSREVPLWLQDGCEGSRRVFAKGASDLGDLAALRAMMVGAAEEDAWI